MSFICIMEKINNKKDARIDYLIMNSFATDNIGLLFGKMGYAMTFFYLSHGMDVSKSHVFERYACDILTNVLSSIPQNCSYDFAYGLCGIGWGIDYLLKNQYVEGASLEICEELDKEIMKINSNRLDDGLYYGFKGLLHYVLIHLSNCLSISNELPFDNQFLRDVHETACERLCLTKDRTLMKLCKQYEEFYKTKKNINYNYGIDICFEETVQHDKTYNGSCSLANGICKQIILG